MSVDTNMREEKTLLQVLLYNAPCKNEHLCLEATKSAFVLIYTHDLIIASF